MRQAAAGIASVCVVLVAAAVLPAGAKAALAIEKWEAGTCKEASCTDAGSHEAFYTEAAGHPQFGITDFRFDSQPAGLLPGTLEPTGKVANVRVDLPAGLGIDPEAAAQCTEAQFQAKPNECPPQSKVGYDEATGTAAFGGLKLGDITVTEDFDVYNLVPNPGEPARFGVVVESVATKLASASGRVILEGGISWYHEPETAENSGVTTGDYHEYFKIRNIPTAPEIVESKLVFEGRAQGKGFITLPSTCDEAPATWLHVDSYESPGTWLPSRNPTPVKATGCNTLAFHPTVSMSAASTRSDEGDAATIDLELPQSTEHPENPDSPEVQTAEVTLPPGMTLNPAAAKGLEACTAAEVDIGGDAPVTCPAESQVGSVAVTAPGLPAHALTGGLYIAAPAPGKGPESGEEFRVFLTAESSRYGVGVRLEGHIRANAATGQLTAVFNDTPEIPFEDFEIHLGSGSREVLANPLTCGPIVAGAALTPYTGQPATAAAASGFTVDADGAGGSCANPLAFSPTQELSYPKPALAGAYSPFTLAFNREQGRQYLSQAAVTLPEGLLGAIPSVTLCGEAQANAGTCAPASQIGTVTALAGSGPEPYPFTGTVYLTGPYQGAPYGLSIVVPAVAGPYDLGNVVVRGRITVGLYDARITASASIPTVFEGVLLRLRDLQVAVDRSNFLFNPTSCAALPSETVLSGLEGASQPLVSSFQAAGCEKLAFKPTLTAITGGHPSKAKGASLKVTYTQPAHQGDIRQLTLQLPKQLPTRDSTLNKACPAATFEAGPPPGGCASTARVGGAVVTTPVLPGKLEGPAYLVSHGSEAFPDLDLVLHGDNVTVVLVGHTFISTAGITTSKFETLPDVPVSSVTVNLPMGEHSILGANAKLCGAELPAPATFVSQSGAVVKQPTQVVVSGCPLTIVSHKIKGHTAVLEVLVPRNGRLSLSGPRLRRSYRKVKGPSYVTATVPLTRGALAKLRRGHKLSVAVRVGFIASGRRTGTSANVHLEMR